MIRYQLTSEPSIEPVTLEEAKAHARIEHDADDGVITGLITMARRFVESRTGRALITQAWTATLDRLPASPDDTEAWLFPAPLSIRKIRLAPLPVASITSLVIDGTTIASGNYRFDGFDLVLKTTVTDSTDELGGGIVITYSAGYGATAASVPRELRQAIKLLVSHLYENREVATPSWQTAMPIPFGADQLMGQFVVMRGPF